MRAKRDLNLRIKEVREHKEASSLFDNTYTLPDAFWQAYYPALTNLKERDRYLTSFTAKELLIEMLEVTVRQENYEYAQKIKEVLDLVKEKK